MEKYYHILSVEQSLRERRSQSFREHKRVESEFKIFKRLIRSMKKDKKSKSKKAKNDEGANMKHYYYAMIVLIFSNPVLAASIERTLNGFAKKGQSLILGAFPIFVLIIGYLYKRGKSEAKERAEGLVIGMILVVTAFGWAYLFK